MISIAVPESLLREMIYDETSKTFLRWKTKKAGRREFAGTIHRGVRWQGKAYKLSRIIWALHHGDAGEMIVDHIDRDPTNNRISNLRLATSPQNQQNVAAYGKSGYKGVYPQNNKFRVIFQGKSHGTFDTAEEAARVYNQLAKNAYGEFAFVN